MTIYTRTLQPDGGAFALNRFGLAVPKRLAHTPPSKPTAADLFCGAGGFSLGFIQAGWDVVFAIDNDVGACQTYFYNLCLAPSMHARVASTQPALLRKFMKGVKSWFKSGREATVVPLNREAVEITKEGEGNIHHAAFHLATDPDRPLAGFADPPVRLLIIDDVRNWAWEDIRRTLAEMNAPTHINAVIGGPPCQGFSRAGKRQVMDLRNSLVFEFVRLVHEIEPETVCFENVPDIADMITPWGEPVTDAIQKALEDKGYLAQITRLQALGPEPVIMANGRPAGKEKTSRRARHRAAKQKVGAQIALPLGDES